MCIRDSYYWTKDSILELAEATAKEVDRIADALKKLQPNDSLTVDGFFERAEENLRQGQVRIIFFMEESPVELRTVVDFLNKQIERSEVLLVEAQQYGLNRNTPA